LSGIGRELARQFATNGFDLIVAAEDDAIVSAACELEGLGAQVVAEQVDLSSGDGVDQLCRRIDAEGGPWTRPR